MQQRWSMVACAVCALAIAASPAAAQRRVGLGFSAGLSVPTGNTGDFTSAGYNVGAMIDVPGSPSVPFGLRFEGKLDSFSGKNRGDPDFRSVSLTGNAVVNLSTASGATPYIIGGVGVYNGRVEFANDEHASDTNMGLNGGAGVRFPLSGFSTFVEFRYHHIFGDGANDASFLPLTFGIVF
jgi:opacity protein-like surface antigen